MKRRTLIGGGAALLVVAGGGYATYRLVGPAKSPESEAAEYAKLLAEVHDDYVSGRVAEHQGWILSQHEFDTLGTRQPAPPAKPAAG